jgi:hypothetical protein
MARPVPLAGRTVCRLAAPALVLLATVASAEPIKYALVGAAFGDGGQASGYLVFDLRSGTVADPPVVADWALTVSGGDTPGLNRFAYDPTFSGATVTFDDLGLGLWRIVLRAPAGFGHPNERRLKVSWSADGPAIGADSTEECACSSVRLFASGSFQRVPGPVVTLKINGQHPASRVSFDESVHLTLDLSPAGWTTPLDWYWAIVNSDGVAFWVTPSGISRTPAPLSHGAPMPVTNATLLQTFLNSDTEVTFWVIAADGPNVISADHMIADVPPSP